MRTSSKNCGGCRFWSEMIAGSNSDNSAVEAMCLAPEGPYADKYTTERMTCPSWKHGEYGAIDSPPNYGEEVQKMYAAEEAQS